MDVGMVCTVFEQNPTQASFGSQGKIALMTHETVLSRLLQKCLMNLGGLTVTYPYLVKQAT